MNTTPESNLVLTPEQSLALRALIAALKADDGIFAAAPAHVRSAVASILLPSYTCAEQYQLDMLACMNGWELLATKMARRINELEGKARGR